jgi:hypothetical protein
VSLKTYYYSIIFSLLLSVAVLSELLKLLKLGIFNTIGFKQFFIEISTFPMLVIQLNSVPCNLGACQQRVDDIMRALKVCIKKKLD